MTADEHKTLSTLGREHQVDLVELQDELRGLAPTVELEEGVLAIARGADQGPSASRLRAYGPVLGLLAAASVLALFLVVRGQESGESTDAPRYGSTSEGAVGPAGIANPRTPAQVQAWRRAHPTYGEILRTDGSDPQPRWWVSALRGGGHTESRPEALPAWDPIVRHGWILPSTAADVHVPEAWNPAHPATRIDQLPRPRPVILGQGLLKRSPELVRRGVGTVLVTLGDPVAGGARVRTRARLDPSFTGTLLVPEDLALALGLEQYELSADVERLEAEGRAHRLHRSIVTLAVPGVIAERRVVASRLPEALSVAAGLGHEPPAWGIDVSGPTSGLRGVEAIKSAALDGGELRVELDTSATTDLLVERETGVVARARRSSTGPMQLALRFTNGASLLLPPLDLESPGGLVRGVSLRAVELTLAKPYLPRGARVVASTTWRGNDAIAGPSGVFVGTVEVPGHLALWVPWGFELDELQLHVQPKEGEARIVRVVEAAQVFSIDQLASVLPPTRDRVTVVIPAQGMPVIYGWGEDGSTQHAARALSDAAFATRLKEVVGHLRTAFGKRPEIGVVADPRVPMVRVAGRLRTCLRELRRDQVRITYPDLPGGAHVLHLTVPGAGMSDRATAPDLIVAPGDHTARLQLRRMARTLRAAPTVRISGWKASTPVRTVFDLVRELYRAGALAVSLDLRTN